MSRFVDREKLNNAIGILDNGVSISRATAVHELNKKAAFEWIIVNDCLPSECKRVLCLLNGDPIVLELGYESPTFEETFKGFHFWFEPYDEIKHPEWNEVTHWMPLPAAISKEDSTCNFNADYKGVRDSVAAEEKIDLSKSLTKVPK